MRIREYQTLVHNIAKSKGWYDKPPTPLESHALITSEVAECTEAVRINDLGMRVDAATGKPEGEMIELADIIIRVMDYAEFRGYDLETAIRKKVEYNRTRPYKHGNKVI